MIVIVLGCGAVMTIGDLDQSTPLHAFRRRPLPSIDIDAERDGYGREMDDEVERIE